MTVIAAYLLHYVELHCVAHHYCGCWLLPITIMMVVGCM